MLLDYDYIMSRPLSEKEQKEIDRLLKIKKPRHKRKYKILVYPTKREEIFTKSNNGFEIVNTNIEKNKK